VDENMRQTREICLNCARTSEDGQENDQADLTGHLVKSDDTA